MLTLETHNSLLELDNLSENYKFGKISTRAIDWWYFCLSIFLSLGDMDIQSWVGVWAYSRGITLVFT